MLSGMVVELERLHHRVDTVRVLTDIDPIGGSGALSPTFELDQGRPVGVSAACQLTLRLCRIPMSDACPFGTR